MQTWLVTDADCARAALAVRKTITAKRMSRFIVASIEHVAVGFVPGGRDRKPCGNAVVANGIVSVSDNMRQCESFTYSTQQR